MTAIVLSSCNWTYRMTHKSYPLPDSFTDTLNSIESNLEDRKQYIYYSSYSGNCHGPSYSGKAMIRWIENGKSYCRQIYKDQEDKEVTDIIEECDFNDLLQEFRTERLDTVKTFPKGNTFLDPAIIDRVIIKDYELKYERTFEQIPFATTRDTNHILYSYLKKIMK